MHKAFGVLAAAAVLATGGVSFAADLQGHVVALSGRTDQYGPGFSAYGDNTFGQFGKAMINNAGQIAFGSSNQNFIGFGSVAVSSLFLYQPGSGLELVARAEGDSAPFANVETPYLAADGSVAFRGLRTGGNSGFSYKAIGNSPTLVAEVGNTTNGTPPAGTNYGTLTINGAFAYRGGNLAFGATLQGPDVTFTTQNVLVRSTNGAQGVLLTREGASGSNPLGTDNGNTTWNLNINPFAVNTRGDVAFLGGYGNAANYGEPSVFGVIDGVSGEVTTVAVSKQPVAGATGLSYTFLQGSGRIDINDAGSVVWMGRAGGANPNVLSKRVGSTTTLLARAGDTLDGTAITGFSATRDPVIAGDGAVYFEATIGNVGQFGIFRHSDADGFKLMVATSDATRGPGGGLAFSDITQLSANAGGEFAFYATLSGAGITSANDEALYAYRGGMLSLIAREGDLFDVDPTSGVDLRTIYAIVSDPTLINSGGQDGRRNMINDSGDIAYSLLFKDGGAYTAGVFISPGGAVPEVGSLAMLGIGAAGLLLRRR